MFHVDTNLGALPLQSAWVACVHRLAVAAGCATALSSLLQHVPVRVASLRGAIAWAAVWGIGRSTLWLMARTVPPPEPEPEPEEQDDLEAEPTETA